MSFCPYPSVNLYQDLPIVWCIYPFQPNKFDLREILPRNQMCIRYLLDHVRYVILFSSLNWIKNGLIFCLSAFKNTDSVINSNTKDSTQV